MNPHNTSPVVPLLGVEGVERENSGKKVVRGVVQLEERHGPTPARRVVTLETRDGAVYRFQRYGTDEYLAFYNRENADGTEFSRAAALPEHVEAVRDAVMSRDVLPDFEAMLAAEEAVGDRQPEATDEEVREAVEETEAAYATDGGVLADDTERRRAAEARLRAGYPAENGGGQQ